MTSNTSKSNTNGSNENIAESVARTELINMVPYQSARRLVSSSNAQSNTMWLNANEASGPGIYQLNGQCINRYPDFQPENLINAYASYADVAKDNVLATRGADEGIELIIRTFCRSYQDSILICPPTYGMYAISAATHSVDVNKVELVNNCLDIENIAKQVGKVNVVFLCSPGNPTGNILPSEQIQQVLELFSNDAIVVVDEAYIEFSPENSVSKWLVEYPNLVVLRTLSKAFALAGLRCGFTIANKKVIELLSKVIAPYPIAAPVADIASEALANTNLTQMRVRVQETNLQREQFSQWLSQQTWCDEVYASNANFVLFRTKEKQKIFDGLMRQGILIRDQSKQVQLENCLRISIGNEREMNAVKNTINQIMNKDQGNN